MPKAKGKIEFRYFLDPELKDAAMRKAHVNGWNLTFVLDRFLREWAADAPPAPAPERKAKGKGAK